MSAEVRAEAGGMAARLLRAIFSRVVGASSGKAHLEVELKFHISAQEAERLPVALFQRGFKFDGQVFLADSFLPVCVPGEMMRVRQERPLAGNGEERTCLTFKQWVATRTGRTRREAERQVTPLLALIFLLAGRWISGSALLRFSKKRRLYTGASAGENVTVSLDDVCGLGEFSGHYLEAEVIVALDGDPVAVEENIRSFVEDLLAEKRAPEKSSYYEMLVRSLAHSVTSASDEQAD